MAQIDTLKTLLQIEGSAQDTVLQAIIDQCNAEYLLRTHQSTVDNDIVTAMSVERYNKLGNEGVQSLNYSGIQETYFSDYSAGVTAMLRSKTRMVTL
jgi:hypothetical protein